MQKPCYGISRVCVFDLGAVFCPTSKQKYPPYPLFDFAGGLTLGRSERDAGCVGAALTCELVTGVRWRVLCRSALACLRGGQLAVISVDRAFGDALSLVFVAFFTRF